MKLPCYATATGWYAAMESMVRFILVFLCAALTLASSVAQAQDDRLYVATYIEVAPQSVAAALPVLKNEVVAARGDDGCVFVRLLHEIGRDDRFLLVETWVNRAAFEAHEQTTRVEAFDDRLKADETAPLDERVLNGFWMGPSLRETSVKALWVVTHVDVMPNFAEQAAALLKHLGEESAKEPGNLRFVVTRQEGHTNHFTVGEVWADRASFEVHQTARQTKDFRADVGPMLGALFDQRIYQAVE